MTKGGGVYFIVEKVTNHVIAIEIASISTITTLVILAIVLNKVGVRQALILAKK